MPMQPPPARESVCFGVCCGCFAVLRIFLGEGNSANGDAVPRIIFRFQWDSDDDPQSGEASAGSPPFLFLNFRLPDPAGICDGTFSGSAFEPRRGGCIPAPRNARGLRTRICYFTTPSPSAGLRRDWRCFMAVFYGRPCDGLFFFNLKKSAVSGWSLIADWSARSSSATPRPGTNASAISTRASNSNKSATPCCGPPPRKPVLRFRDGSSAPAIRSANPAATGSWNNCR